MTEDKLFRIKRCVRDDRTGSRIHTTDTVSTDKKWVRSDVVLSTPGTDDLYVVDWGGSPYRGEYER
jgi:hypothetical protein